MAKNDLFLIDGILDEYITDGYSTPDRGTLFEVFCLEQILKSYDLSVEEIIEGHLDGGFDGGIDGAYLFVNGNYISSSDAPTLPKTDIRLDVFLINCKHHDTFKEATLNTLVATVQELFDLSKEEVDLSGSYHAGVLEFRSRFAKIYKKVAVQRPALTFHTIYASRGDVQQLGETVAGRAEQFDQIVESLFSEATSDFNFIGATELVQRYRSIKTFDLELPFKAQVSGDKEGYILFTALSDYFAFLSDEHGQLRRYLMDSNIRDYLGQNKVNLDIQKTLSEDGSADFWWLNNGITILATSATITGRAITMKDIQIINGLQTSETIYNHFSSGMQSSADKTLAVKVIVSENKEIRDQIIIASNNQSQIEQAAFRATDKIQQDIEDTLEREGWFYERRKNYYRNVGKQRWSRKFRPVVKVDRMMKEVIRNEETKEPLA